MYFFKESLIRSLDKLLTIVPSSRLGKLWGFFLSIISECRQIRFSFDEVASPLPFFFSFLRFCRDQWALAIHYKTLTLFSHFDHGWPRTQRLRTLRTVTPSTTGTESRDNHGESNWKHLSPLQVAEAEGPPRSANRIDAWRVHWLLMAMLSHGKHSEVSVKQSRPDDDTLRKALWDRLAAEIVKPGKIHFLWLKG